MRRLLLALLLALPIPAATGNIQYLGTVIDSGHVLTGYESTKAYDADFSTFFSGDSTGQWTGMDIGAAVTMVRVLVTPRTSNNDCTAAQDCWDRNAGATVIEASNSSDFTGAVTLDTLTRQPLISQMVYNRRPVSPSTTYRYYRLRFPSGYGDLAELRWIGTAASVNGQPVAPAISPWGGAYTSGSTRVTITSETTSAAIHYTTDGSDPTCSSTLYSAPFSLTVGAATTLKAIACDASLSTQGSELSTANFRNYGFKSGDVWSDVSTGVKMQGFAGGISGPFNGRYYWVGQWMLGGPCAAFGFDDNPCTDFEVWLYSSSDFYNWRLEGMILDDGTSGGHQWKGVERPHIIYNASTHKYVLWAHCFSNVGSDDSACIATASAVTGPWTWRNLTYNPGHGYKDCNLFVDEDGTGYTMATDISQGHIYIYRLASDYLSVTGDEVLAVTGGYESPVMFRRGSTYYLIYGASTVYGASVEPLYLTASSPLGTWGNGGSLFGGEPPSGFGAQPTFVFKLNTRADAYVYGADLWSLPVWQSTHLMVPLTFDGSTVSAATPSSWDLSYWAKPLFPLPSAIGQ